MTKQTGQHTRTSEFVLKRFERWALPRLAARLPAWVVPDHLTVLGLLASTMVGLAYVLTNVSEHWLWLASGALIVQWYGDSLDGTLARYRNQQRPRYGFYVDHIVDSFSATFLLGGLALSGYMSPAVAAGLHVYMAKPVAVDVPGCLQIEAAGKTATEKKRCFLVDYQMPTDPATIEVVKRLAAPGLGKIARGRLEERARFHFVDGYVNADLSQLRLNFLGYLVDIRQIHAHHIAISQRHIEAIGETGFVQ